MNRSYISEIASVREWKEDALYLYSDAHKDAYGVRSYPSHLLESEYSMEEVMESVFNIYEACNREAERERKATWKRAGKNHYHWLMLQEASRTEGAVVFKNENFDEWDLRDSWPFRNPYGETYYGDREYEYYIPTRAKNHPRIV